MELIVFIVAIIVLDILALRYGVDSRDGFQPVPVRATLNLPR
jgi:hypothetical protein